MVTKELSEAAVEFNCILENSSRDLLKRIPTKFVHFLKNIESKTYKFSYDKTKSLNEQELKPETRGLIALVYQDYICNEEERKQYVEKCKTFMKEDEKLKREKYNHDNLFNKKTETIAKNPKEETRVIEYKTENFLQKILRKVKMLFKKVEKNN